MGARVPLPGRTPFSWGRSPAGPPGNPGSFSWAGSSSSGGYLRSVWRYSDFLLDKGGQGCSPLPGRRGICCPQACLALSCNVLQLA